MAMAENSFLLPGVEAEAKSKAGSYLEVQHLMTEDIPKDKLGDGGPRQHCQKWTGITTAYIIFATVSLQTSFSALPINWRF